MIDGSDPVEFWSERQIRRARSEHRCEECSRVITVGETYWRGFGKQDGQVYDCATCLHCRVMAEWLLRNCRGFLYGGMLEDFEEHATGSVAMLRVVVGARRQWRRFRDPGLLMEVLPAPADMV